MQCVLVVDWKSEGWTDHMTGYIHSHKHYSLCSNLAERKGVLVVFSSIVPFSCIAQQWYLPLNDHWRPNLPLPLFSAIDKFRETQFIAALVHEEWRAQIFTAFSITFLTMMKGRWGRSKRRRKRIKEGTKYQTILKTESENLMKSSLLSWLPLICWHKINWLGLLRGFVPGIVD